MRTFIYLIPLFVLLASPGHTAPLTQNEHKILHSEPKQKFKAIKMGHSYYVSNEPFIASYKDSLKAIRLANYSKQLGYIGVGAEQNYTLAAMLNADFLWLIDRDENVILGHKLARSAFLSAETAVEFLNLYNESNESAVKDAIYQHYSADEAKKVLEHWLLKLDKYKPTYQRQYHSKSMTNFLSNPAMYTYMRKMFMENRVVIAATNIVTDDYIRHIAQVAQKLNTEIGAIYLSNSIDYLIDADDETLIALTKNIMSLPYAKQARALITTGQYQINAFFENVRDWEITRDDQTITSWVYTQIKPQILESLILRQVKDLNLCSSLLAAGR